MMGPVKRRSPAQVEAARAMLASPDRELTSAEIKRAKLRARKRIIDDAIEYCRHDESARLLLIEALRELGKGKRGRRLATGESDAMRLQRVRTCMMLVRAHLKCSTAKAIEHVARIERLSEKQVRSALYPRRGLPKLPPK